MRATPITFTALYAERISDLCTLKHAEGRAYVVDTKYINYIALTLIYHLRIFIVERFCIALLRARVTLSRVYLHFPTDDSLSDR